MRYSVRFPTNVSILLLYCLTIVAAVPLSEHQSERYAICQTPECNELASKYLSSINASADPCEDFYDFACGSWEKDNPIPPTELEWSEDHKITEKTYQRMRDILKEEIKPDDIMPVKMAKQLYRSCVDEESREKRGLKPMQKLLNHTGGWPMAMPKDQWDSRSFPWQRVDRMYSRIFGGNAFFNVQYEHDEKNSSRYIITIDVLAKPAVSTKQKLKSVDLGHYYLNIIANVTQEFAEDNGFDLPHRQIVLDVAHVVLLEAKLVEISRNAKKRDAVMEDKSIMTIDELQKWYDEEPTVNETAKINWLKTIRTSFGDDEKGINGSQRVLVNNKQGFRELARFLDSHDMRNIVNYVHWSYIVEALSDLNRKMRYVDFQRIYMQYNIHEQQPLWRLCLQEMEMKNAVSYQFVKKYFSDDTIPKVLKMVQQIQENLEDKVAGLDWVNEDTRIYLKDKLQSVLKQIGYPSWYKNTTKLLEYYKGLEIGSNYFENVLNLMKHTLNISIVAYKLPKDREMWLTYPIAANAFYVPTLNAIQIPAAELQDPYFTPDLPLAVNFGAIGSVLGHELAHSFDTDGIQYDKYGNKVSWNTTEMKEAYEKRAECYVNQYNEFVYDVKDKNGEGIQVDGELTENENIADNVGLQAAFAAYQKAKKEDANPTKLPGLEDYTGDQLFFLSFANAWCAATRPKYEMNSANVDEHSPNKFRVIGSVSNLNSFSRAFHCPPTSPMNRMGKCSLWK